MAAAWAVAQLSLLGRAQCLQVSSIHHSLFISAGWPTVCIYYLPQNWVCSPCLGYDWITYISLKGTFLETGALNLCPLPRSSHLYYLHCVLFLQHLPSLSLDFLSSALHMHKPPLTGKILTCSSHLPKSFALEPNHFGEWMNAYMSEWICCLLFFPLEPWYSG